ncbi:MAG: phosphate signaling complex protein PhoU [Candidatus Dormibacteraeota bacterium]|nr:phosphate signaling complex protein PhoU [Candidatus Dormibacteraeota bacterium]
MKTPVPHLHRQVFEEEIRRLREAVMEMGEAVDHAITRAVHGLAERDVEACTEVIQGDHRINDLQREVRDLCFTALLTQAPVAGDLREVLTMLHMASELERMGDHAVSIAKIGRGLADLPELDVYVAIPRMGEYCAEQVRDMLAAMVARDPEQARAVAERDDRVDRVYHRVFDELVQVMTDNSDNVYRATNLVFVAHHLERIADRVTNLAEDMVWLETGLTEELG